MQQPEFFTSANIQLLGNIFSVSDSVIQVHPLLCDWLGGVPKVRSTAKEESATSIDQMTACEGTSSSKLLETTALDSRDVDVPKNKNLELDSSFVFETIPS